MRRNKKSMRKMNINAERWKNRKKCGGKKAKRDQAKKKTVIKKYYAIIFFGSGEHIKRKRMIPGNK